MQISITGGSEFGTDPCPSAVTHIQIHCAVDIVELQNVNKAGTGGKGNLIAAVICNLGNA